VTAWVNWYFRFCIPVMDNLIASTTEHHDETNRIIKRPNIRTTGIWQHSFFFVNIPGISSSLSQLKDVYDFFSQHIVNVRKLWCQDAYRKVIIAKNRRCIYILMQLHVSNHEMSSNRQFSPYFLLKAWNLFKAFVSIF